MPPPRKINDCFYYYNGYCYRGDNCRYRHEPRALASNRVCKLWQRHHCYKPHCPQRHSLLCLPKKISPPFWKERAGWTPFLKSRFFNVFASDQPRRSNGIGWRRRIFFPQANERLHHSVYSPRSCIREWSGILEGRFPLRENIRVELERVDESALQRCRRFSLYDNRTLGNNSHTSRCFPCQFPQNTLFVGGSDSRQSEPKFNHVYNYQTANSNLETKPELFPRTCEIRHVKSELPTECLRNNLCDSQNGDNDMLASNHPTNTFETTNAWEKIISRAIKCENPCDGYKNSNANDQYQTCMGRTGTVRTNSYEPCFQTKREDRSVKRTGSEDSVSAEDRRNCSNTSMEEDDSYTRRVRLWQSSDDPGKSEADMLIISRRMPHLRRPMHQTNFSELRSVLNCQESW